MFILAALSLLVLGVITATLHKRLRRRFLIRRPFPDEWERFLEKDFPRHRDLPESLQDSFRSTLQVLIEEKNFEACGGLAEVTDQAKVLICAQASLLLIGLPKHNYFGKLKSILLYPTAFRDRGHRRFGIPEEDDGGTRLGESWETGSVILSWESVVAGARNDDDGMNVVIHEFAHQLDQIDGSADGVPLLQERAAYQRWAKVFLHDYEELVEEVERGKGHRSVLDPYGATNPAEFFAVASESFFEEPHLLQREHPDLYEQLKGYYGLDPVKWTSS
ncbi:MAG: M90 family metallopeptidase [Verrucomicrobiota bacterium]